MDILTAEMTGGIITISTMGLTVNIGAPAGMGRIEKEAIGTMITEEVIKMIGPTSVKSFTRLMDC